MDYYITDYKVNEKSDKLVALEDCVMQKSKPVTAGSRILSGFVSPFDATVVSRMEEKGYVIAGKTKMDEFGLLKLCENDNAVSGAVRAVAEDSASFALSNDFSGTVRRQAAENGLYYIRPTYGTVSRFGLIPMISSMDQIGIICKDIGKGFELLSVIAGNDPNDGAMYPEKTMEYAPLADKEITVSAPSNVMAEATNADKAAAAGFAQKFKAVDSELKYFDVFKQVQYILGCAEISNNINRYDGIKFGYRTENYRGLDELYINTRTEAFGPDVKLAAIMGSMVLSKEQYEPYYEKSMKLRRMIKNALEFDKYDVIVLPAHLNGDAYEQSALYALATLAGLPSVSLPYCGGAIQIIAGPKNENALITALEVAGL